jgi:threonine/homoserine/homoserine lactone efflux protein
MIFLKGIVAGFAIAAPVGPIGILCIRRTLSNSYILGLFTGLGAGLADTFYGAVAGFGLSSISNFINTHDFYLRLFGGLLVGWIGISIARSHPRDMNLGNNGETSLIHALTSAFFLTLSNPITLLVFAAAFAAMGIKPIDESHTQASTLVMGVFVGATAWWFSLSTAVRLLHHKLSDNQLHWINRISGILLIGFSIYILFSLI